MTETAISGWKKLSFSERETLVADLGWVDVAAKAAEIDNLILLPGQLRDSVSKAYDPESKRFKAEEIGAHRPDDEVSCLMPARHDYI